MPTLSEERARSAQDKVINLPASPATEGSASSAASSAASAAGTVNHGTWGNSALKTLIDAVKAVVDAIKAKTDNLPATPASQGDVTSARDSVKGASSRDVTQVYDRLGAPAGASMAADIAVVKTVVDSNGTKIGTNADAAGTTTLFARAKQIVDSYLADATNGLAALKSALDTLTGRLTSTRASRMDRIHLVGQFSGSGTGAVGAGYTSILNVSGKGALTYVGGATGTGQCYIRCRVDGGSWWYTGINASATYSVAAFPSTSEGGNGCNGGGLMVPFSSSIEVEARQVSGAGIFSIECYGHKET